jgi:hypothetical protein
MKSWQTGTADGRRQAADGMPRQSDGIFFFRKNLFFFENPKSSRKSIKKKFGNHEIRIIESKKFYES